MNSVCFFLWIFWDFLTDTSAQDNLAACFLRAWDPDKPLLVAPAMNTVMWEHPSTAQHLRTELVKSWSCVPNRALYIYIYTHHMTYVYMYQCVSMCMHTCMYIYIYICIYIWVYIYVDCRRNSKLCRSTYNGKQYAISMKSLDLYIYRYLAFYAFIILDIEQTYDV